MSNYALEVRTVQSSAFKTLIEAIKELLVDTCIEFDENIKSVTTFQHFFQCFDKRIIHKIFS